MARYRRLAYVALSVSDLERSLHFYRDLFGLECVRRDAGRVFLRCGEGHHALVLSEGEVGLARIGWLMQDEENLQRMRSRLVDAGIEVSAVSSEECQALCIGPAFRATEPNSGATFEYFAYMNEAQAPFVPTVAKIERLGHVVMRSPRFEAAAACAIEKFNFRKSDGVAGMVNFLRCHPNPYHHSIAFVRGERNCLHHVNFMVSEIDDIGRAMVRLKKNGVEIVYGPGRHPPSESIFLYFLDPDGITVEYSVGMETFPEVGAREPRLLPAVPASLDHWGNIPDPRMGMVGRLLPRC